jgi:nucleotide-binding universal stress UspA family protein
MKAAPIGTMNPLRRILVATDFSETAKLALDYAIAIAKPLDAEIVLMHAWEIPVYAFPDGAMIPGGLFDGLEAASDEALKTQLKQHEKVGVKMRGALRMGPAWREIRAVAEQEHADLIVIGTHGRRGVARFVLGSVAERVVRTAPCPVLTVGARKS